MIKLKGSFFSRCLGRDARVTVLLPREAWENPGKRYPVLYLLHGLTDCGESWLARTSLERYAEELGLAIVLPDGARSFYCDMAYGDAYYTHISREVPEFCENLLPVAREAEGRFLAGNSMGAYGACKIALREPGRFQKVGLFSGVLDIQAMVDEMPELSRDWLLCFGGSRVPEGEDLLKLLEKAAVLPEFYHYCGTEDFLAEGNRRFCALCRERGIPLTSHWEEGGRHEWQFWDRALPGLLRWLTRGAGEKGKEVAQ